MNCNGERLYQSGMASFISNVSSLLETSQIKALFPSNRLNMNAKALKHMVTFSLAFTG